MPSASDELREKMKEYFPEDEKKWSFVDEGPSLKFLLSHGWEVVEEMNGYIRVPSDEAAISEKEWLCAQYLKDEWDFGFI